MEYGAGRLSEERGGEGSIKPAVVEESTESESYHRHARGQLCIFRKNGFKTLEQQRELL